MNAHRLCGCPTRRPSASRSGVCRRHYRELRARARGNPDARALARAWRRDAPELVPADFECGRRPLVDYAKATLIAGDVLVISDVHVPLHDAAWLAYVCDLARRRGIRRLVIAGDALDFSEISRFYRLRADEDVRESLLVAVRVLEKLVGVFPEGIWILRGNHESRLERLIHDATEGRTRAQAILYSIRPDDLAGLSYRDAYLAVLNDWMVQNAPSCAGVVHWLPEAFCELAGPDGQRAWYVVHQRNSSENATVEARKHWERNGAQSTICAHTHRPGIVVARDGRNLLVNLGHATAEESHEYAHREPGGFGRWTRGAALVVGGRIELVLGSPYAVRP